MGFFSHLGLTQPPVQWVLGAFTPRVKRPVCEADQSPAFSAKVKNAWRYTSIPQYVFIAWYLIKHEKRVHGLILN